MDLVTERDGKTYEFFTYNPWGEEMHQYNANTFGFSSPYRFNSKEKDAETGLHYYGARYYQSKLSMWLSVDPKAHMAPDWTPYRFNFDNPIKFIDPDGRFETPEAAFAFAKTNNITGTVLQFGEKYALVDFDNMMVYEKGPDGNVIQTSLLSPVETIYGNKEESNSSQSSIEASASIVSGAIGTLRDSYKYSEPSVKAAQRINGTVRSADVLSRANSMHASKMINGLGRIGGGLTAFSLVSAGVTYAYSDQSGSDNARLAGSVIIMTTSFIPFANNLD